MDMKEYADGLASEVMTEMAENFFSRRVQLENELDHFYMLVTRLRSVGMEALLRLRAFYELLFDADRSRAFLAALGVDLDDLDAYAPSPARALPRRRPFALTPRGRYVKTVAAAYEDLRRAVCDYNEGVYTPDPADPRKKRRSPGWNRAVDMCRRLNKTIEAVNEFQSPYCTLSYAKNMDPVREHQERVAGAVLEGDVLRIDKDLAFLPIPFKDLGLPEIPDLPPLEEIRDDLVRLCKTLYAEDGRRAREVLRRTRNEAPTAS